MSVFRKLNAMLAAIGVVTVATLVIVFTPFFLFFAAIGVIYLFIRVDQSSDTADKDKEP